MRAICRRELLERLLKRLLVRGAHEDETIVRIVARGRRLVFELWVARAGGEEQRVGAAFLETGVAVEAAGQASVPARHLLAGMEGLSGDVVVIEHDHRSPALRLRDAAAPAAPQPPASTSSTRPREAAGANRRAVARSVSRAARPLLALLAAAAFGLGVALIDGGWNAGSAKRQMEPVLRAREGGAWRWAPSLAEEAVAARFTGRAGQVAASCTGLGGPRAAVFRRLSCRLTAEGKPLGYVRVTVRGRDRATVFCTRRCPLPKEAEKDRRKDHSARAADKPRGYVQPAMKTESNSSSSLASSFARDTRYTKGGMQ